MAPMRRKSQGSIRSPPIKRNIQSQVTFEGWLFKLEGGALKQWKQRWCALVDFCLFFYKAPHEEKVISSILLPSYKINPCSTDDKISKKFAFKAEHQNMKTYYFATEDKESMKKWMNAMSLASIMQNSENHISAMCSYDDDDSGFTSYRSRYHSNRSSSVHNTSTTSEPLKQRSNSCGDRVGEMYLGSDDKYPNLYKSTSSQLCKMSPAQDIPRKQPLYANAPPKPRRLTQTDGFAIHPSNCYDSQQSGHMESSQYNAAITSPSRYVNQENPMQCLPMNSTASNASYVHSVSPYLDNDLNQTVTCQNLSNVYKNKTPRPRSADFLERDNECTIPPNTSQYWETRQPQRPKSSLECYNHIADCEDYDFDDYRDAIRMQADNLYSNKNMMKNRNFLESQRQVDSITKSDPRLNARYDSRPYFSNDTVPSYPQMCTKEICNDQLLFSSTSDPQHKTHTESKHSSKPSHNESMQRLLEWKQRMLQSPLSRRNHLHSVSSDASSANSSKQADYYRQSANHTESYNQYHHLSGQDRNLSYQNQNVAPLRHEILETSNQYDCTTGEEELDYLNKEDRWDKQPVVPETDETNNQHIVMSDTADTLYQKNILYCVDSENNEILLSYDTSPTSSSAPVPFHSSHYPPQMHSFSTLPNVNDIGLDPTLVGEQSTKKSHIKSKQYRHEMNQANQDSSSVYKEKQITYSSDDEASAESDNRYKPLSGRGSSACLYDSVSVPDITSKEAMQLKKLVQQSNGLMYRGKRLSVSAGDLLGKTHEELVLLLIQLRRNQSKILKAKDKLESKIKKERILQIGSDQTSEHYEELCNQIIHLEKQYEVTQPLVTLVDNMVELGSLYGSSNRRSLSLPVLDSAQNEVPSNLSSNINFQQTSILSKLLKEEKDLQKQISEISKSEKYMQNETHNLSVLHQDKEMLEHTLFGMRNKILDHQDRPAELQKLRKQQRMIEKELIRVKRLLSTSAKKIEDATCKNDQMEQEILHLRQILQQALKTGSTEMKSQHNRADLEAELARLQSVLDELANHRHEISNTVEKLKNEASTTWSKGAEVRASPTGVAGSAPLPLRKKHHCMYLETDLDTMVTRDLAVMYDKDMDDTPVYANAEEITLSNEESPFYDAAPAKSSSTHTDPETCSLQDINEADERMKRFYGILPKEKPSEIKTVRIVKRQSERRSRERDKKRVSYDDQSSVWIMEEPDLSSDDYLETEESNVKKLNVPHINRPSSINLSTSGGRQHTLSAHERLFGSNTMPKQGSLSQVHSSRKPKRRHYTVSGYQYMLDPQFAQYFSERPRSRDDVDMERCLRTANTPDIVRSTIKRNDIFDDKIIERELGLPQKIEIPERYVEVEPEQLSATEKLRRSLKAENICKMLSETTTSYEDVEKRNNSPEALHQKLSEEKRKRAHLLSLNQALAREVVERSKVVAVFATLEHMMKKPLTPVEEDLSPMAPLPITQQRYNFLT